MVIFTESDFIMLDSHNPTIQLLSPNPNGDFDSGEIVEFSWLAEDDYFGDDAIDILYAESIGDYFQPLNMNLFDDGFEFIDLPQINEAYVQFRIIATDFFGNNAIDNSDGYFIIGNPLGGIQDSTHIFTVESTALPLDSKLPTLELILPNGGEVYIAEETIDIQWSAFDDSFDDNAISFGISPTIGSGYDPVGPPVPNLEYYSLPTPDAHTNYARLNITATDFFGNTANDYSDGYFAILDSLTTITEDSTVFIEIISETIIMDSKNPIVDLYGPNGGNQFESGSDITAEWFAEDDTFEDTPIDFSIAVGIGEYFIPVENDVPNLPEYVLTLPEENHPFVRMRILAEDLFGNTSVDESQDYFILGDPFEDYVAGEFDDLVILNWGWGKYHLVAISSDALSFLDPGDEIYILDENGIIEEGCPANNDDSFGPIITGSITYDGPNDVPYPIICTGSIDYCDLNGPRLPGYIDSNEIHFLIHDIDIDEIYEVFATSYTIGSGIFGEPLTLVDSFEAPQLMDRPDLSSIYHLRSNRVDYSANIFRNDELIESLDDSDFYFDSNVLLGEQYCYMIEIVDELNAQILNSSTECLIIGEGILGCTDINANNFNPLATIDDGSCEYDNLGDVSNDGVVDVIDIVYFVDLIFYPENQTDYHLNAGDLDGDGSLTVIDIVYLVDLILDN